MNGQVMSVTFSLLGIVREKKVGKFSFLQDFEGNVRDLGADCLDFLIVEFAP